MSRATRGRRTSGSHDLAAAEVIRHAGFRTGHSGLQGVLPRTGRLSMRYLARPAPLGETVGRRG